MNLKEFNAKNEKILLVTLSFRGRQHDDFKSSQLTAEYQNHFTDHSKCIFFYRQSDRFLHVHHGFSNCNAIGDDQPVRYIVSI